MGMFGKKDGKLGTHCWYVSSLYLLVAFGPSRNSFVLLLPCVAGQFSGMSRVTGAGADLALPVLSRLFLVLSTQLRIGNLDLTHHFRFIYAIASFPCGVRGEMFIHYETGGCFALRFRLDPQIYRCDSPAVCCFGLCVLLLCVVCNVILLRCGLHFCFLLPNYYYRIIVCRRTSASARISDVSKEECLKLAATLKKVSELPVSCRQHDDVVKIVENNMNPYAGADRAVVSEAKIQRRLTTRRLTKKKDRFE